MDDLRRALSALDPPVKHFVEYRISGMLLTLLDPEVPAKVSRFITSRTMRNAEALNLTILYAVNELRLKGSHLPLHADTVIIKNNG